MTDEGMLSPAWLWKRFSCNVGALQLADGRLSFTLKRGGKVAFDAPLEEVEVLGWETYGAVRHKPVQLRVAGKKYRLSFVPPTGAAETERLGDTAAFGEASMVVRAARSRRMAPAGIETGNAWRSLLDPNAQSEGATGS